MQGLSNDIFAHIRAIGVRSVDEIDPQLDGPPQNADSLGPVRRLSPNSFSRDSHCAESEPSNTKIISDHKFVGLSGPLLPSIRCGFVLLHVVLPFDFDAWRQRFDFSSCRTA